MKVTSAILCSETKEFDRNKVMASYSCPCCGNNTVVQASMEQPYCVHCGHDKLKPLALASREGRTLLKTKDSALASVKCPSCATHLIMNQNTVIAHTHDSTGHLHCPVCSEHITFASNDFMTDETEENTDTDNTVLDNKEPESTEATLAKHKVILANTVKGKPHFITVANKVLCLVNNVVIATSEQEEPEQAEDMANALEAVSNTDDFDLENVLEQNDFELSTVDVDVNQELLDDKDAEVEEKVQASINETKQKLKESFGLALAGCNRGLFESENYLRSGLVRALIATGLDTDTAESLCAEVMCDVADDFVEEIQRITFDLLAKPDEVRNELVTTVASIKMQPKAKVTKSKLPQSFVSASTQVQKPNEKHDTKVATLTAGKRLI